MWIRTFAFPYETNSFNCWLLLLLVCRGLEQCRAYTYIKQEYGSSVVATQQHYSWVSAIVSPAGKCFVGGPQSPSLQVRIESIPSGGGWTKCWRLFAPISCSKFISISFSARTGNLLCKFSPTTRAEMHAIQCVCVRNREDSFNKTRMKVFGGSICFSSWRRIQTTTTNNCYCIAEV